MELNGLIEVIHNFYPKGIDLDDNTSVGNSSFANLTKVCLSANDDQKQWRSLINKLKAELNIEITEFVRLSNSNPSFIAVFLVNDYEQRELSDYGPQQLILKISVIAPVYEIYFDNLVSDWNKRLVRKNPVNEKEKLIYERVQKRIEEYYFDYICLDMQSTYYILSDLGNISAVNSRKPYLDECLFGLYLSTHPHNILTDAYDKRLSDWV